MPVLIAWDLEDWPLTIIFRKLPVWKDFLTEKTASDSTAEELEQ